MMHLRSCRSATLILLVLTFALSSASVAHEDRNYNLERRSDTPPPPQSRLDVMFESFETSVPPAGWAMQSFGDASQEWSQLSIAHSGNFCAGLQYCDPDSSMNEWLVTPALDFSGLSVVTLEFYEDGAWWADWGDHHYITVSTTSQTDTLSFSIVEDMTPANHNVTGFDGGFVSIDLSAYAGESTVYVAFRYTGSNADSWYVDDVRIFEPWLHDVRISDIIPYDKQYEDGESFTPQMLFRNPGRSTESYDVELTIYESGTQIYNETQSVANHAPGGVAFAVFPSLTVSEGNYYEMRAEALLGSDMDMSNNVKTVFNDTYTQGHVPLGILLTQAGCSGCPPANAALDDYIPTQGNEVAIMRVHVWWPGTSPGSDIMYDENVAQNRFLAIGSGADFAPHLRIDQVLDPGSSTSLYETMFNARKSYRCPLNIAHVWDPVSETVTVEVEIVEPIPASVDLTLRIGITEDDVFYDGAFGSDYHNQAFRYMYPDTDGFPVPGVPGKHRYTAHCPVSAQSWVYENLRVVAYVQDEDTWKVFNTTTGFLSDSTVAVDEPAPALLKVKGNHPNPFNPETTIAYELSADRQVTLSIYDVDGSLVRTLIDDLQAAGLQSAVWDGRDLAGQRVASGTYFYRIDAGEESETRKMVMVK